MEDLGRNPQDLSMYPTVWSFIGNLATFYIYDLIKDVKTKNRIQKLVSRLKNENENLAHDYREILEEYRKALFIVFPSEEIVTYLVKYFENLVEIYKKNIIKEKPFLSEKKGKHFFSLNFIYKQFNGFCKYFEYILIKYDFDCPEKHLEVFFPFYFDKKKTPFNETISWIIKSMSINKRQFAQKIGKGPNQMESALQKTHRWTNESHIPNFVNVIEDLSPIFNVMDEKKCMGVKVALYFSIALSRIFNKVNEYSVDQNKIMNNIYSEILKPHEAKQKQYLEKLYNPFIRMLDDALFDGLTKEQKVSNLSQFTELNQNYIEKYYAEGFVYFITARIHYKYNEYERAAEYYLKAFNHSRYRIGHKTHYLIHELLYCCRLSENKKLFKRVYSWQSFILGQSQYFNKDNFLSYDQMWDYFSRCCKYLLIHINY